MPPGNEDWSNGKIYKIISNNPDIKEVYYGSTVQKLLTRMAGHRDSYTSWIKGKGGCCASSFYLFEKYGVEQFHIELIENYPCESREQLHTRENIYIRGYDCVNKKSAITTREELQKYNKQYKIDNKDKIREREKQYKIDNKERLKQYRIDNKDRINIQHKEKITCECGCEILKCILKRHKNTEKHKKKMELLNN